ncbi:hypothetical protein ACO2Q5_19420 [Neotabrizicola sp. VNH66]
MPAFIFFDSGAGTDAQRLREISAMRALFCPVSAVKLFENRGFGPTCASKEGSHGS